MGLSANIIGFNGKNHGFCICSLALNQSNENRELDCRDTLHL